MFMKKMLRPKVTRSLARNGPRRTTDDDSLRSIRTEHDGGDERSSSTDQGRLTG